MSDTTDAGELRSVKFGDRCVWCGHDFKSGRHAVSTGLYTVCCYDAEGLPLTPVHGPLYLMGRKVGK